jgi:hypothetical protein
MEDQQLGGLLHDNAPANGSVLVEDFLGKNNVTSLDHPHTLLTRLQLILLFHSNKSELKGPRLSDDTDIIKLVTEEQKSLSQNGFQECFQ